jgi:serine/threonine protein kinase/formylglycine-generating enzyme required for sulfatase activity
MNSDSKANWSDSENTYRAFDSSEVEGPRKVSFATPAETEEKSPTLGVRGSRSSGFGYAGSPDDEDAVPYDADGYLFGKYRVLHKIGGGGMGFVWLVEHVGFELQRALKVIKSEVAENPANLERFRREARILAKLSRHPNAVTVYDTGFVGKFAYIEMDYLEGQTLKKRLEQGGIMSLRDVAWFLGELCAVLGEAHRLGIVHRDIKPQNIMVVPDSSSRRGERVKVLDFGIAKIVRDAALDTGSLTLHTEGYLGTYPYSSPEQLGHALPGRPEAIVDCRSDIYSLGVLLYEMLSGIRPFSGAPTKLLYDHAHTPPPPFAQAAPEVHVPTAVESVVMRCLKKDPDDRPQSADDLARLFREAVLESEGEGMLDEAMAPAHFVDEGEDEADADPADLLVKDAPRRADTADERRSAAGPRPLRWRVASGVLAACLLAAASAWVLGHRVDSPSGSTIITRNSHRQGETHDAPVPAWIGAWLTEHRLDPAETKRSGGWPVTVRRKDRDSTELVLNGPVYLPAACEPDSPSGTAPGGWPRALKSTATKPESRFVLLEGGEFLMGAFDDRPEFQEDEKPGHRVTLSPFYIQETEVSIGDFATFCRDRGLKDDDPRVNTFFDAWRDLADLKRVENKDKLRDHPATGVSHRMAVEYARWIGGDLPTEAQWEFAARSGGVRRLYVWPDGRQAKAQIHQMALVANPDESGPCEVRFTGNEDKTEQGLYHMAGNVREWCRDVWRTYRGHAQTDPVWGPEDGEIDPTFAIRGGSHLTPVATARVTWRRDCPGGTAFRMKDEQSSSDLGFRVVMEILVHPETPGTGTETKGGTEDGR